MLYVITCVSCSVDHVDDNQFLALLLLMRLMLCLLITFVMGEFFKNYLKMKRSTIVRAKPYLTYCQNLGFRITPPFALEMYFAPFVSFADVAIKLCAKWNFKMYLLVMASLCNEFEMSTYFMNHTFFVLLLNNDCNIIAIHKQQLFKIQVRKCVNVLIKICFIWVQIQ